MKKWIILILVLAAGSWGLLKWGIWRKTVNEEERGDRSTTAVAEPRDIRFAINAAGDIGPADQVSVRPEINGRIATLDVDIGDQVSKGNILFTLDDRDLQTERGSRLIEIEGAKLQLEQAKRNYDRSEELFKEKLISLEVYQDSKTTYELAKNGLERAQKDLNQVEDQLTKTKIVAPFDCTVLTRPVSMGQAVSGSGGFNSGTEVLTIANLNDMVVNAHINQADVTRLRSGQEVDIEVEAVPGLHLKGEIERIAPQATIKNGIKGFATRIKLTHLDARVRPGMTANLSIPVVSAAQVLSVPLEAVFTEEGDHYVLVKQGDFFERRPVQIGVADYFYAEVQKGLKPGEVVALEQPPEEMIKTVPTDNLAAGSSSGRLAAGLPPGLGSTNRFRNEKERNSMVMKLVDAAAGRTNRTAAPVKTSGTTNLTPSTSGAK
ncbi:MAG: efflux RND transporter periplasmic adaptor subunit [Candidatus Omnitrophica bacterium]|nr:efflux RND transporter periplasmic adaptor subunit [Candidatus Omnitrophota bacterium]